MRIIKWLGIMVTVLIVVLTVVGFILPSTLKVSRSTTVAAPPSAIYPLIANFKDGWHQWNAFDQEDPSIRYTYEGPTSGEGARQIWHSDSMGMGSGSMTIVEADPETGVRFELRMGDEDAMVIHGQLQMAADNEGTRLSWTDDLELGFNPFKRLVGPMIVGSMEVGFEHSLAAIKKLAEASALVNEGGPPPKNADPDAPSEP